MKDNNLINLIQIENALKDASNKVLEVLEMINLENFTSEEKKVLMNIGYKWGNLVDAISELHDYNFKD